MRLLQMSSYQVVRKRKGSQYQYRLERQSSFGDAQLVQIFWTRDEAEQALRSLLQLETAAAMQSVMTESHDSGGGFVAAAKARA